MATAFDKHPKLLIITATASVIAAWFAAMYLLVLFGFPQSWIVMIAPISSVVVAGIFLYLGRKKLRGTKSAMSAFELDSPVIADNNPPTLQEEEVATVANPQSEISAPENAPPAVDSEVLEVEDSIPEHTIVATEDNAMTNQEKSVLAPNNSQSMAVDAEIPAAVKKVMDEIEKRTDVRCIIIAAPSHGVLQDRLNNWLSGGYGRVVSASMAMNGKGFYLTVFYEPIAQ